MRRFRSPYIIPVLLLAWLVGMTPLPVESATNSVLGGIGGINNGTIGGGDGTGTGQFTVNAVRLSLVKQARDNTGVLLPDGATVASGQVIYFVLIIDNTTAAAASDIRLTDPLNESEFTYVPNSMAVTTVASAADPWGGVWAGVSDSVGGPDDVASIIDSNAIPGLDRITVGNVSGQVNQQLNIPGATLWAIRFQVTVK